MRTVHRHRVQPLPFLGLAAFFGCAPLHRAQFPAFAWDSPRYWAVFAGLAIFLWAWYASRSLVVSDRGVQVRALFGVPYEFAPWTAMEEWTTFVPPEPRYLSMRFRPAVPPGRFARWLWGVPGTGVRLIIRDGEALAFFPSDFVRGWDIEQALKEHGIPFRR